MQQQYRRGIGCAAFVKESIEAGRVHRALMNVHSVFPQFESGKYALYQSTMMRYGRGSKSRRW